MSALGFLDLPPEVRNHIYQDLLPVGRYYTVGSGANTVRDLGVLSLTSRSLRQEILPVFYGNTEFILSFSSKDDLSDCLRWLQQLDNRKCSWIHDLTLLLPNTLQVHFSAQPDMLFERSGVKIFCSSDIARPRSCGCGWSCRQSNRSEKIETEARKILESIRTIPGDSGLRIHHIAQLIRVIFKLSVFEKDKLQLVKRLSDRRRKRM